MHRYLHGFTLSIAVTLLSGCSTTTIIDLETPDEFATSSYVNCTPENVSPTQHIIVGSCSRQYGAGSRERVAAVWNIFGSRLLGDLPGARDYLQSETGRVEVRNSTAYAAISGIVEDDTREVVIVGRGEIDNGDSRAFYWTASQGMKDIGVIATHTHSRAYDIAVTPNGEDAGSVIIVGVSGTRPFTWQPRQLFSIIGNSYPNGAISITPDSAYIAGGRGMKASRWHASTDWLDIGELPRDDPPSAEVRDMSADGQVVVGGSHSATGYPEAFRWTQSGGMQPLGVIANGYTSPEMPVSKAWSTNGDGSVIVGYYATLEDGHRAFFWTESLGLRDLKDYLSNELGLDMTGWVLKRATGISKDGTTIVGDGNGPTNNNGWAITGFPTSF